MHEGSDHNRGDADPGRPAEIMSNLPRKRPQRRSALRDQARATSTAQEPKPRETRIQTEPPPPARPAPKTGPRPRPQTGEQAPGLAELAVDSAVEALKVPLKVGAEITFKALDAVTRNLRSR